MAITMGAVKMLVICVMFTSTCLAMEELMTDLQEEILNQPQYEPYSQEKTLPSEIKLKRDERSHPRNINQADPKLISKVRPTLNLRLDSLPRNRLTATRPVAIKAVKIPIRILPNKQDKVMTKPINTNHKSNGIIKEYNKKSDQTRFQDVKPSLRQFFEDSDELICRLVNNGVEHRKKGNTNTVQTRNEPVETKLEKDEEVDEIVRNNLQKPEISKTHVEVKPKLNKEQNVTKELAATLENKLVDDKTHAENPLNNFISRMGNYSNTSEVSSAEKVLAKTTREFENNNKTSMEQPSKYIDRTTVESNNTNIVISNHDFEEFSERSNGYTADTINIENQDPITTWNYLQNPYQSYDRCSFTNDDASSYNYKALYSYSNTDDYGTTNPDPCNYQVIDVKPESTDRIYRTWKNTEIKISKGSNGNPISINVAYKFDDVNDRDVIKTQNCYRSQPAIWNGYYGNQNTANRPYFLYPQYQYTCR